VTRRGFLAAGLAGAIAALALPFERFAEWCAEWLGARRAELELTIGGAHGFALGDRLVLAEHGGEWSCRVTKIDRGVITLAGVRP
jgi:hypothetical protein